MSWALGVLLSEFTGRYQLTAGGATGGSAEHEALFLLLGLREIGRDGCPVFLRGLGVAQVFAGLRGGLFGGHVPLYLENNFGLICSGFFSAVFDSPRESRPVIRHRLRQLAAENGLVELVSELLGKGVSVHAYRGLPLMMAEHNGHTETVRVLKNWKRRGKTKRASGSQR